MDGRPEGFASQRIKAGMYIEGKNPGVVVLVIWLIRASRSSET